jgi:hypothetical protein
MPLRIWLRNCQGEDVCVNNALAEATGLPAEWFIGKTYESSGLDPALVSDRLALDEQLLCNKEIVVVRELSRFGLVDTLNAPVISRNGIVEGTLHISTPLDSSGCRQSHRICLDKFGAALQL